MNQAISYNLIDTGRDPNPAHKTSPFSQLSTTISKSYVNYGIGRLYPFLRKENII